MTLISYQLNRLTSFLMKLALWVGIALCIAMTVSTIGQVFCRHTQLFLFESSEEIARFSMCWMAMLGSAVALRQGRHLGVRVLVDRLPAGWYDKIFAPMIQLVMFAFFIMITVKGWAFAMRGAYQVSPALMTPMMYPYLSIPVGGALMALSVLADILQDRFPTEAGSNACIASTVMEDLGEIAAETEKAIEVFDPLSNPKKESK